MRGGAPLEWLEPLDSRRARGVIGTHAKHYSFLNLEKLPEGMHPRWVHKRNVPSRRARGYRVATPDEVTLYGGNDVNPYETGTGEAHRTPNLVLMIAPLHKVEEHIADLARQTKDALHGDTAKFLDGGSGDPEEAEYTAKYPIRFTTNDHGVSR
jgi:hypothetical protein